MTEITRWRDPAAPRTGHHFVPGLPEPTRTGHLSRSSQKAKDGVGGALESWLDDLTIASTVDGD